MTDASLDKTYVSNTGMVLAGRLAKSVTYWVYWVAFFGFIFYFAILSEKTSFVHISLNIASQRLGAPAMDLYHCGTFFWKKYFLDLKNL